MTGRNLQEVRASEKGVSGAVLDGAEYDATLGRLRKMVRRLNVAGSSDFAYL
jgi:hypothetical protein